MAIELNSNLSFSGNGFLDSRQNKAKSISDLLNWDFSETPIPLGFEVFVENDWYTFGTEWNETTGYFKVRKTLSNTSGLPGEGDENIFMGYITAGEPVGYVEE